MTLHASWTHGVAVRPEWVGDRLRQVRGARWDGSEGDVAWSDVNGLPRGWGVTYRALTSEHVPFGGARTTGPFDPANPFQYSLKGYWFHVPVPTPVIEAGVRATLHRVFVLWTGTTGVRVAAVHVWDGAARVATLGASSSSGSATELLPDVTQFEIPSRPQVRFGLNLAVGVCFLQDGDVTFHAAGADFDI